MAGIRLTILKNVLRSMKKRSRYHDIHGTRRRFARWAVQFNRRLPGFTYQESRIDHIRAEWVFPKKADAKKVLLYFHGGGYAAGSIDTHRALVSQIAKHAGIAALSIDYRLAPEHTYPAPLEDAAQAYRWLLNSGFAPHDIAFGGDSAGGGISIGSLLYLRDNSLPVPRCAFALSPWLDHTLSGATYHEHKHLDPMLVHEGFPLWSKNYLGSADPRSPYASPIFHDLKGLPPVYLQVGSEEMLLDDSIRFADKAKAEGVEVLLDVYPEKFHVFQAFWMALPKAREANQRLGVFLKKHLY